MGILSWLKRRRLDEDDFQDEIRAHLAIAEGERMADGADPQTARHAALKEFGNVTLTTEAARRVWTPRWLEALRDLVSDVRYAIRTLAKNPAFSLTVVGVLTLGVGLNAAVFTMLKGIALTPISGVANASTLAVVYAETTTGRRFRVSYPDYQYLREHAPAFAALFGSSYTQVTLGRGRGARLIAAELVTGHYFQVLGVRAAVGRTLLPSDEVAPGRHPVAVIGGGLWRREFAADPGIVGRTIQVNNYPFTVVGVADPAFHGTIVSYDVELFVPVMMSVQLGLAGGLPERDAANMLSDRRAGVLFPHAFVRPGASLANARAQVEAAWATLSRDRPTTDASLQWRVVPFRQSPTGGQTEVMPLLVVLSAMALLVLLVACANIAGLVLVRGLSRRGEIAVRLALGASRGRIVRLLVIENLALALPGAALGVLISWNGIPQLVAAAEQLATPQRLFFNVQVDGWVIGFAALVACASAVVFGLVPAVQSVQVDLVSVINTDASPRGAARGRFRATLVVVQVAVSLLLLVGAGLTSRSVEAARRVNPGFDMNHVAAVDVDLTQNAYDEVRGHAFYRKLLDEVRADPAVDTASLSLYPPLAFLETRSQRVSIEGYEPRKGEDLALLWNSVTPDYFRTLRMALLAGRLFDDHDDPRGAPVAIVNDTFARRFWGGAEKALGKRLRGTDGTWRTVVGVAADVKYLRLDEAPRPYFYLPFAQAYRPSMILQVRGTAPIDVLVDQARKHVEALDADLPLLSAWPLADRMKGATIFLRFAAMMLFLFGTAGMALAALGTYGLVSYAVKQSTQEIGIRMALGATAVSILRGFLGRGLRLGAMGAALGILAALGATSLLRTVLFGVSPTDAVSFARALAVVLGGVIVATIVPAWRAARTNPLRALRHQ